MRDEDKTKEDLIDELREMRRRVRKLRNEEVSGQTFNTRDSSEGFTIGSDFTQGKRAENSLHRGIATIEALLNATRDMVYLVDREGTIIVANHGGVEFLGGSHHKLIGASIFDFFPPELAAARRENLDEVIRSGSPLIFEDKHYARHFENSLYPILGEEGVEGIAIYSRDITNNKRGEKALKESKEKYKRLIEMMNEGLWVQDEKGVISFVNDRLCEMLGYSSKEMIGHWVEEFIDEANLKKLEDRTDKSEQQSAPACEIEWRSKNGRTVWTIVSPSPLYDAEGVFLGNFAVITDITDRKRAEWSLKKAHEQLERRVTERTAELQSANEELLREIGERKKAEEAALASESFLNSVIDQSPYPIWISDERGTLMRANNALRNLLHISDHEVVGKYNVLRDNIVEEQGFLPLVKSVFEGGDSVRFEIKYDTSQVKHIELSRPTFVILDVTMFPIKDSGGKTTNAVIQHMDVTERKHTAAELRQSNDLLRAIIEAAPTPIIGLDVDGNVQIVWNPAAERMLGWSAHEIMGRPLPSVAVEKQEEFRRLRERMRSGKSLDRVEVRWQRRDGTLIDCGIYASPLYDGKGRIAGNIAVLVDFTERKQAEEKNLQLAAIVESSDDAITGETLNGIITSWNKGAVNIYGYQETEVVGMPISILVPPPRRGEISEILERIERGEHIEHYETMRRKKDGREINVSLTISPIRNAEGVIVGASTIARDITVQKNLQRQLLQSQKMEAVGTLAGGIAHDFNNLLTVVMGFSELLLAEKQEGDPDYADLQKMLHAAKSGAELVQRLLMFSRKSEPKPVSMNLNKKIVEVEKLLRRTIPRMVDIKLDLSADLPEINADSSQIDQVLMNLAVNARDAMPHGGKLTVRTSTAVLDEEYSRLHVGAAPGEYVLLEVSDTGHGMDKGIVEHIFEPFFTTKAIGRGTGLGLAMVHGIVKQHNGYLTVYSEGGKGTTFRVYLPVGRRVVESDAETRGMLPALGTETVLLVDDEELIRDLGTRILTKHGYTVLQARNGRDGLDLFKRERSRISLVILDLIMPEMGGAECLKELLKIDPNLKVLIASGYSADSSVKETIQMGAKGFVTKPFRVKELVGDVRSVLDEG